MRLIDADALMETIRAHDYPLRSHFNSTDNGMFTIGIQQAVDEQPTVDAVEVVRCKDCKWYVPYTMENKTYKMCRKAHLGSDDFYCADGERKSE